MCYSNWKVYNTVRSGHHALGGKRGMLEVSSLHAYLQNQIFKYQNRLEGIKLFPLLFFLCICFFAVSLSSFSSSMVCRASGSSSASSSLMPFSTSLGVVVMFHTVLQHSLTKNRKWGKCAIKSLKYQIWHSWCSLFYFGVLYHSFGPLLLLGLSPLPVCI